ncbi:MAG: hypothetical protein IKI99_05370 [Firmicutes bacterium]|nr:hypothetical protein [Bacillota bacterium]
MKRKLMVLGLVTSLFFTGFAVCNIDQAFAAEDVAKKDRKYTENEIDSTVKVRANQLIDALDGRCFTSDGYVAGYSGSGDDNVLKVLNKSKRVRKLNKKYKGGKRPPDKSCLPYIYTHSGQMMPPAYSCVAFAMYAQWYMFANRYNDDVEVYKVIDSYRFNYKNMKRYARPGDVIWTSGGFSYGHASVVLDVTRQGVKVLDSNTAMYSSADYGDNRVCVYILEYSDQSTVTISRPKNYYVHYSDGLKKTSYEKDARTIHEQVVARGDSVKIQKKKFKREGYTYSRYYITKVTDGKVRYLCKNKKTGERKWLSSKKITKAYKKVTVKAGDKLKLSSKRVKKGREITLMPVWKKKSA